MFVATLAVLAAAVFAGFAARLYAVTRRGALYTFPVDPPTMLVAGFAGALLALFTRKGRRLTRDEYLARRPTVDRCLLLFFVLFWTAESLTYFNVLGHPFDPALSGHDFMWNGYLEMLGWRPFDYELIPRPGDPNFALFSALWLPLMAALQYGCLRLGRVLGYRAGTSFTEETQNGTSPSD